MNLPNGFKEKMQNLLGEDYKNYLQSFVKDYGQTFRMNQLKTQPAEFLRRFAVKRVPWCETGYYYGGEERLSLLPYYYGGIYYIQEPCAMAPASFLPVKPGDKVLDLCAAPGGKTTALAAKLKGEGVLVANDISISRCKGLLKNIEMAGIKNAVITCEQPEKLAERFPEYFDCVLVDAPCSGEGMFRKEPGMAAEWSEEKVEYYSKIQKELLVQAARMVRAGGFLLYSTCTYSPEENEQAVETLFRQGFSMEKLPEYPGVDAGHPEWSISREKTLKYCRRFWNHRVEGEGQFAALLKKKNGKEKEEERYIGKRLDKKKEASSSLQLRRRAGKQESQGEAGRQEMRRFFARCRWEPSQECLQWIEERVFLLPENAPDMRGLRVVRSGLYLGDCKKNRFEPSQALAAALTSEEYEDKIIFSAGDPRVEKYLRCETIELKDGEMSAKKTGKDGWVLVCAGDMPLGWGKCSRGVIKNKFAPGWRKQ